MAVLFGALCAPCTISLPAAAQPGPFEAQGAQIRRIADACVGWSFTRPALYDQLLKAGTTAATVCQCAAESLAGAGYQIGNAKVDELVGAAAFRDKLASCSRLEIRRPRRCAAATSRRRLP